MDRTSWDRLISGAGAIVAIVLIVVGAFAVYGGKFGQDNVSERLEPQKIYFPPYEQMTAAEQQEVGEFAGQQVVNGVQAEAYSRYIGGHLMQVNDGKTYSETSAEARDPSTPPDEAAELQAKADTLFQGETLRSILLNAYGWWTVSTLAVGIGLIMVLAGFVLAVFVFLGFRHAGRSAAAGPPPPAITTGGGATP
jgi:hypothetical protein